MRTLVRGATRSRTGVRPGRAARAARRPGRAPRQLPPHRPPLPARTGCSSRRVLGLIVVSAILGAPSPFLLREIFDVAIPEQREGLLSALVGGMIAIAIVTGALGVVQTLLSNQVGQRVMHDLRAAVYRHLQRLSLAFFTRTRTGEVQSRIANDIGGVEDVLTSTATSVASNVTTVIATVVAMFLLDWRLAVFSLALLPLFVWLTRRVGEQRRQDQRDAAGVDGGDLVARAGVAVGLAGSCSARRWAARPSSPAASRTSRSASPSSRCARGWRAAG